ncbi:MAG: hypothetical protein HN348_13720 [Proteobacteria bacterium]|jgi:Icc-related predicted phosphoesterase|nr:hypothetical protein [Pseudomonadota bacterium]
MTTLAVIGDIHAQYHRLNSVLHRIDKEDVDGVLLVGDLGSADLSFSSLRTPERDARYLDSIERVLQMVRSLGVPLLWVPGNHDLSDLEGEGNIDFGTAKIEELVVAGIGGAGPNRFGFCYEWGEDDIRARPEPQADVLLCHCPPANTALDLAMGTHHAGSEAIMERARRHRGFLVCGHIHEAAGAVIIGDCLALNAGALGHPFGRNQVGFICRKDGIDIAIHEDLEANTTSRWERRHA